MDHAGSKLFVEPYGFGHRDLTEYERIDFKLATKHNIENNYFMSLIKKNRYYALLFPIINILLLTLSILSQQSILLSILGLVLGLLSIQTVFVTTHMWAHGLMLEYDAWKVCHPRMKGLPSVVFYAFYHHHHSKADNWFPELSYYVDDNLIMESHWESFSLFTSNFPISRWINIPSIMYMLFYYPSITAPYLFGYELGVILLPISHDWVHLKKSNAFGMYYIFKPLEMLGLFASVKDHKKHHNYTHETIYQSFSSSGIYTAFFDRYIDNIWNNIMKGCNKQKPFDKLWKYVMMVTPSVIIGSLTLLYITSLFI